MSFYELFVEGDNVGWLPFDKIVKKDKNNYFKDLWNDLRSAFSSEDLNSYFYFTGNYDFNKPNKLFEIKVSLNVDLKNSNKNLKVLSKLKNRGEKKDIKYGSSQTAVRFYITGGNRGSGILKYDGDTTKQPTNDQQELATIYAIQNPKSTIEDVNNFIGYKFDNSWLKHLEESKKFRNYKMRGKKVYTDSSKIEHDATSKFASDLFKIIKGLGYKDKKDNWNPSDFWILNKSSNEILRELKQSKSIQQFNDIMKKLFEDVSLVGVSLKKINKSIKIDIVDPSNRPVKDFTLKSIDYKYGQENFFVETDEGFKIRVGKTAKSGSKSIYYEGRMQGSKVQLGAISRIQLIKEFSKYGYNILDWEQDPKLSKPDILELHKKALNRIIKEDKRFLEDMYYLAMKQSKESSIYLKVH